MALKVVFFYNQNQAGWTETYFAPGSNPQAYAEAFSDVGLGNLNGFRAPLTVLYGIRVSDTTNPRNAYFRPLFNRFFAGASPPPSYKNPDVVSTDVVVRLVGDARKVRRVALRGLLDDDVTRANDGSLTLSARLISLLGSYISTVKASGFQIQYVQQPPNAGLQWFNVASIDTSALGDGFATMTMAGPAPGFAIGQLIRFTRVDRDLLPGFPRSVDIVAVDNGPPVKVTIPYFLREGGVTPTPKMRLCMLTYAYDNITQLVVERASEHKTGRPFGTLRGRSRGLVRAQ